MEKEYGCSVDAGCLNRVAGIAMSEVQRATAGASTSTAKAAHSGGLSVHAGMRVAAQDRAGRERLLRYSARPMFAGERLV